jgi:hypothetical protein
VRLTPGRKFLTLPFACRGDGTSLHGLSDSPKTKATAGGVAWPCESDGSLNVEHPSMQDAREPRLCEVPLGGPERWMLLAKFVFAICLRNLV